MNAKDREYWEHVDRIIDEYLHSDAPRETRILPILPHIARIQMPFRKRVKVFLLTGKWIHRQLAPIFLLSILSTGWWYRLKCKLKRRFVFDLTDGFLVSGLCDGCHNITVLASTDGARQYCKKCTVRKAELPDG